MAPAGNIKVVVRVRPFNSRELDRKAKCVVQMKGAQTVLTPTPDAARAVKGAEHGAKTFAFDRSYWSFDRQDAHFAGQDAVFQDLGTPLLDNAFQGYNNCIFAYGQTGSGKSYSMMGYGEQAGVIPKVCEDMFNRIDEIQRDKNLTCTVEVSYLEIYNERVRDLLNPSTKGNLKVREHPSTGPYVEDLAKLVVRSFKEIQHLMDEGNKARTVAATNMNETSSRSHAVFTLILTQRRHDVETSMDTEKVAKISLVDLAGSERATSTGATGARLKEGAEINRSLSTLGRVIATLADLSAGKKKNASMVPYRDSVLTWLLKDSLGGNSLTAMIAAISPADINFEETLSTLRYADSAKRIKNHAVVNEDPNARMIRELKEELAQLRSKLGGGAGAAGAPTQEQYAPGTPLDQQFVSIIQADGSTKKVSKAEIAEQLSQSEKLYEDLNQTWEQKLHKTEEIHKEREAALEELGISIEKGFVGLSTPKKMPHLVNLSDDPLLAGCLVYNLKPGVTTLGNLDNEASSCEIRLHGTKILREHCTFENNNEGVVTLNPAEGAAVMVNGQRIDSPKRLRTGNRIILGDFHIFRFNHPQEARAERAEQSQSQSLLRHSVTASQIDSTPSRPLHERSMSRLGQTLDGELSRSESPLPGGGGRDSDWAFARREAAAAILGPDQKINTLTDEELNALFDDIQRARAIRKGRPESRLLGPDDDESESASSYAFRDKYMSNGTIDNFSLDTALTIPGTPQNDGDEEQRTPDDKLQQVRDSMQAQLDKQKDEYQEQLRAAEASNQNFEQLKAERERMEEDLRTTKENLQAQLKQQKLEFETQLQEFFEAERNRKDRNGFRLLTASERRYASLVVDRWRQLKNLGMAETMLTNAVLLKEAQVMSQVMDKGVTFQFAIVEQGQEASSSYDMVLNGIADDDTDDEALQSATKPCVAVRIVDFNNSIIRLWSLQKLEQRLQAMRRTHQYHDRPEYLQHFKLDNPFTEDVIPSFSLVGDAHVPLAAVFEERVQDYAVDVVSPHTQQVIGVIRLSLEPSSAQAPASMLKFNVVMHDMNGFAEREGTDVHAQMVVPGTSKDGGATTTQMIKGFDEGAIRFESVHSMSVSQDSPENGSMQIAIFARVSSMHLDKLLSWDEVRELAEQPPRSRKKRPKKARLPETEYYAPEQHDVFAKIQILEPSETGEYQPVEVEQNSNLDEGTYQLRQGLQRRIKVHLTHMASETIQWENITSLRVGHVKLVDPMGKTPDKDTATPSIPLKFVQPPKLQEDASGTAQLFATAQWDSSLHDSVLLDRPTADRYSVRFTLSCDATSKRVEAPLTFELEQTVQVRPRTWIRPQSLFKQLWVRTRIVHTTIGIFSITLTPSVSKLATDLWRLDSRHHYVKGEEVLEHWTPRGVSLVHDFAAAARRRQRITEVEAAKAYLARLAPTTPNTPAAEEPPPLANGASTAEHPSTASPTLTPHQEALLTRTLALWRRPNPVLPAPTHLASPPRSPIQPPTSPSASPAPPPARKPPPTRLAATVAHHPKNPVVLKAGPLLAPAPPNHSAPSSSADGGPRHDPGPAWLRRHAELRPPYLHLYAAATGEAVGVLNLRAATLDAQPAVARLLVGASAAHGGLGGGGADAGGVGIERERERARERAKGIWAVYAPGWSAVFWCRGEAAKMEWLLAVDRAFLGSGAGSGEVSEG